MRQKGFTPIIILLVVAILGVVVYFAYTRGYLGLIFPKPTPTITPKPLIAPSPSSTSNPTNIEIENKFTIQNGDIYNNGKLIVNHDKFSSDFIQSFSDIKLSPDNTKICFLGFPPGPAPIIYISEISGNNVVEVQGGKNCIWSNDSLKIAFINSTTDISPVNIYVFDLKTKMVRNISKDSNIPPKFRIYSIQTWSSDSNKIIGEFTEINESGTNEIKGSTEFDLLSGKAVDF